MRCPRCGGAELIILETRSGDDFLRRRRRCRDCDERLTTYERIATEDETTGAKAANLPMAGRPRRRTPKPKPAKAQPEPAEPPAERWGPTLRERLVAKRRAETYEGRFFAEWDEVRKAAGRVD